MGFSSNQKKSYENGAQLINGKKILAVVPARGGSKGIPLKNIANFNGKTLVELAGEIALSIPEIDRRIVSTDHPDIAKFAEKSGLHVPFLRPNELSGDRISDLDVLTHALNEIENIDNTIYDIVVMLQPTSPLRLAESVKMAINMLFENDYDSVWAISETDSKCHPLKQLVVKNGKISYWDENARTIIARQQLTPTYHRNGVVYVIKRDCILNSKSIMGENCGALIVDGMQISIDTVFDLKLAELSANGIL